MEKLFVTAGNFVNPQRHRTKFITLRYGNVFGSSGSVVPLWINQIQQNEKISLLSPPTSIGLVVGRGDSNEEISKNLFGASFSFSFESANKKIIRHEIAFNQSQLALLKYESIEWKAKNNLLKKVTLVTPNVPEAEVLSGASIKTVEDMVYAAKKINILGVKNVLIKGGHLSTKKIHDVLLSNNKVKIFNSKKIITKNTHGTGCTLSSAIATFYSCGKTLKKSCELGVKYVNSAILTNPKIGIGHGPINHLNSIELKKIYK